MRRWRAWSAADLEAAASVALWPIGLAVGLLAERVRYGWSDEAYWVPDLVVGLVFIGCGAQALARRRGVAVLLAAVGFSWLLADFWADALYLHRGVLVQLVVAYPGWRPRDRREVAAVAAGYGLSLGGVWGDDAAAIVAASGLAAVVGLSAIAPPGRGGSQRRVAFVALLTFTAGLAIAAGLRRLDAAPAQASLWAYQAALCAIALLLTAGLPRSDRSIADLVVELGEAGSGSLRDALAAALGDPTLQVGYRESRGYVDDDGIPVRVPEPGATRVATFLDRGDGPSAVLVHDATVLGDPALLDAVRTATILSTTHAELQATVRTQLAELVASRRRLVTAADAERRRLTERLRAGAEAHMEKVDRLVRPEASRAGASLRVGRVLALLEETQADLHALANGLYPPALERGLAPALAALAARSPLDVEVRVVGDTPGAETTAAAYFVCAEALANVAKHSGTTSAAISVGGMRGVVTVEVVDGGVGGADEARGSGLRGLADRVEALGGTLRVDSPPGGGTRLVATVAEPRQTLTRIGGPTAAVVRPAAEAGRLTSRSPHDASTHDDLQARSHPTTTTREVEAR